MSLVETKRNFYDTYIKPVLRFLFYRNERDRFFRERHIRKEQDIRLAKSFSNVEPALILFLVPGASWFTGKDDISGGVLSIASLYGETKALEERIGANAIMCTFPRENLLMRHESFENDIDVFRFSQLPGHFQCLQNLLIHIPEFQASAFQASLSAKEISWLEKIPAFQVNILNQNINLMPEVSTIRRLECLAGKVTVTTAHAKYSTAQHRQQYGVPLHLFSTFASPEDYAYADYEEKEDLLVLSPDSEEKNREIINMLAEQMPSLTVQVIRNLKYQDYKLLIRRAKWSLTFGEGLDFYFIEPVFSGGISFAIFNNEFFTEEFQELSTVTSSYEELCKEFPMMIRSLDEPTAYRKYQEKVFRACARYYSKERYRENIANFYAGRYSFP